MSEKLYRIILDEDSYRFTQDEYNKYVAEFWEDKKKHGIYSINAFKQTPMTPEELRTVHLENAWNAIFFKRYKDPKPAYRYIKSMQKHFSFIDFFVEETELNWKRL